MADQPQYLTPEGVKQLEQELEDLRTHRRKAVADLINESKELGTSLNNAEYDEAVHVGIALFGKFCRFVEEGLAGPENDRRGQNQLDPSPKPALGFHHRYDGDWNAE